MQSTQLTRVHIAVLYTMSPSQGELSPRLVAARRPSVDLPRPLPLPSQVKCDRRFPLCSRCDKRGESCEYKDDVSL